MGLTRNPLNENIHRRINTHTMSKNNIRERLVLFFKIPDPIYIYAFIETYNKRALDLFWIAMRILPDSVSCK